MRGWLFRPALWWQFWLPQSGIPGGLVFGVLLLVVLFVMFGCAKEPPPPPPPQIVVVPAYPAPPIQATPWPQVFFPQPPVSTTIIDNRQFTVQQQLQVQRQLQQQWVYDPVQRKVVRRFELAPTTP